MRFAIRCGGDLVDGQVGAFEFLFRVEADADQGPVKISFVDLRDWVMALPGFDDDPKHSGEKILEAIQQAWIDEIS